METEVADCMNGTKCTTWDYQNFWWIRTTPIFPVLRMEMGRHIFLNKDWLMHRFLSKWSEYLNRLNEIRGKNVFRMFQPIFSLKDERSFTCVMEVKIAIWICTNTHFQLGMWFTGFSPQSILYLKQNYRFESLFFFIQISNISKCPTHGGFRICESVNIYNWYNYPIVVVSQIPNCLIRWCEQFIQKICCSGGCDPFASVNICLNENCWFPLCNIHSLWYAHNITPKSSIGYILEYLFMWDFNSSKWTIFIGFSIGMARENIGKLFE